MCLMGGRTEQADPVRHVLVVTEEGATWDNEANCGGPVDGCGTCRQALRELATEIDAEKAAAEVGAK
jgi:cytidine deaminase